LRFPPLNRPEHLGHFAHHWAPGQAGFPAIKPELNAGWSVAAGVQTGKARPVWVVMTFTLSSDAPLARLTSPASWPLVNRTSYRLPLHRKENQAPLCFLRALNKITKRGAGETVSASRVSAY
jgi:hypothetical protein